MTSDKEVEQDIGTPRIPKGTTIWLQAIDGKKIERWDAA